MHRGFLAPDHQAVHFDISNIGLRLFLAADEGRLWLRLTILSLNSLNSVILAGVLLLDDAGFLMKDAATFAAVYTVDLTHVGHDHV